MDDLIDPEVKTAIHRAKHRKSLREPVIAQRMAVSELMRPLREDWETATEGQSRGVGRYDGTGMLALDQAGATIYSMLTATDNMWAPLEFEEDWRKADPLAKAWINEASKVVFRSLDPSRDTFYNDAPEVILDSIGLGDGIYYSARQAGSEVFQSKAIPWREACYSIGNLGEVTHFDRWYSEPLWNIADMFGKDVLPARTRKILEDTPDKRMDILHTVIPNDGSNRVSSVHRFKSLYVLLDTTTALSWGGYRDMPYYVSRWGVGSGQTYGMGRGVFALPDTQMLNEMSRTGIVAAQRDAEPPWAVNDEFEELVNLDPNALNVGLMDDNGNVMAKPMNSGGNVGLSLEMQDQRRSQIKDIFYHAMLSMVGSPTPSVVEVLKNAEQRDQSMGPNLARIITEFLSPFILGRYRELLRAGRIPPAPPAAQSAPITVRFVSPLARAHKAQAAQSTINAVRGVKEVAELDPTARFAINGLRASKRIIDGLAAPDDIMNSEEEIQALMGAEQQEAQGAQELEVAERGSRAVESLARAQQAAGEGQQ
jgi:head-to-tail connecting protein